ncbi:MAG: hypothetical protein M5R36_13355 [Deltaproteobacteria bacterium]|nr:hypothetical protein [Deltaproteobacteria bacterium]
MPSPVSQIQSVLARYNRMLRSERNKEPEGGVSRRADTVRISAEGRRQGFMDRIGDAAVKAYRQSAIGPVDGASSKD